jgi:hypothetical protein
MMTTETNMSKKFATEFAEFERALEARAKKVTGDVGTPYAYTAGYLSSLLFAVAEGNKKARDTIKFHLESLKELEAE